MLYARVKELGLSESVDLLLKGEELMDEPLTAASQATLEAKSKTVAEMIAIASGRPLPAENGAPTHDG